MNLKTRTFKKGLSLRYKLLALLATLPMITLALYLVLALRLFESDKIAYVLDSSAAVSRTTAAQTLAHIKSLQSLVKPILEGYDARTDRFDATSSAVFKKEATLISVQMFRPPSALDKNSVFKQTASLKKNTLQSTLQSTESWVLESLVSRACASGVLIEPTRSADKTLSDFLYLAECYGRGVARQAMVSVSLFRAPELFDAFKGGQTQALSLTDASGSVVLGPAAVQGATLRGWKFLEQLSRGSSTGTSSTESPDGNKTILSYTRVNSTPYWVVAMMDRATALQAVRVLLLKSVLFLIALLSIAVVISVIASNRFTSALRELDQATVQVASGNFSAQVAVRSKDEVGSLAHSFNQMAHEVSRLMGENIQKARMEKELETARTVQETLFPIPFVKGNGFEVAGHYEPASECGGDWWHHCKIGDQIFLWIGDVTGHGAPAALVTSAARSAASIIEGMAGVTPSQALGLLNKAVFDTSKGSLQMTFFLASLNTLNGELRYANASHNSPFLIKRKAGTFEKKDLITLDENNNPRLGEQASHAFKQSTLKLELDDTVVFFTDGVIELVDPEGKTWGERGFVKTVLEYAAQKPSTEGFVTLLTDRSQSYRKGAPLKDDVTYFALTRRAHSI